MDIEFVILFASFRWGVMFMLCKVPQILAIHITGATIISSKQLHDMDGHDMTVTSSLRINSFFWKIDLSGFFKG